LALWFQSLLCWIIRFYDDHDHAEGQPVIDYHCHLPPAEIAADINFRNLTHIWLEGDHYKWRGMRTCGVAEKFITGDASDTEKFMAWAETVPKTLRNPLYHWTHMELKNPFGTTDRLLNSDTAGSIWDECNEMLQSPEFSTRSLLKRSKVKVVATTDDPTDSMERFDVPDRSRPHRSRAAHHEVGRPKGHTEARVEERGRLLSCADG
jgi:glucuronate isomerase